MEQTFIEVLNTIKYPGAVVVFIIYGLPKILELIDKKWVKNNLLPQAELDLIEIKDNHLHDIKNCLNDIKESNKRMENHLQTMNDNLIYIRARTNGK